MTHVGYISPLDRMGIPSSMRYVLLLKDNKKYAVALPGGSIEDIDPKLTRGNVILTWAAELLPETRKEVSTAWAIKASRSSSC